MGIWALILRHLLVGIANAHLTTPLWMIHAHLATPIKRYYKRLKRRVEISVVNVFRAALIGYRDEGIPNVRHQSLH